MLKKIREWWNKLISYKAGNVIVYTIFWMLCAIIILFIFRINGKSFLWMNDGVYQHFSSFQYLCDYLKDLIYNFHFQGFFDYTLGQGMDVLTTLNSYDFTDPISILCACVFPLSRIGRYTLMIFIKLYLIGIAFLFYCHVTERRGALATSAGALAYVFSGAILFTVFRHPNYINWAYFFPLLLGGIELYDRKGKKWPLIIIVFLNIVTSYYTFYMNVILVAIYVLIHALCRVVRDKKLSTLWNELKKCIKIMGVCGVGVLLAAFILFPTIYAYINNNRVAELTGYTESALFYEEEYYQNLFEDLFAAFRLDPYTSYVGLNAILIIPLILLFTKKKQYTELKILLIISLLMMCIPMAGRIMNGFGYATNRFAYIIPFYASVILVVLFSSIGTMTGKEKTIVFSAIIVYVVLCCLDTQTNTDIMKIAAMVMILVVTVAVGIVLHYRYPSIEPFLFSLVILGSCFQIYFTFPTETSNYVSEFLNRSEVTSSYADYSSTAVEDVEYNTNFYRTEMEERRENVNKYNHVYGTGFWWSMVSGDVMNYYTHLGLDSISVNCGAGGLDGRSGLLELASVKYYTRPAQKEGLVPYGYTEISSSNEKYQVFENKYALPIGYTYSSYITEAEYDKLNIFEKEQALLQGAVLEEDTDDFVKTDLNLDYEILNYEISSLEGVIIDRNEIQVSDNGGEIKLNVEVPDDTEIYVYLNGPELEDNIDKISIKATRNKGDCSISKSATISNLNYNWAVIRDSVALDVGYGYAGDNIITLTFDTAATIFYDEIQIVAVPMSVYEDSAIKLGQYVLEDIDVGNDQISGTISLPEERILQFSVPYSEGWKAYVDGEEVSIMKSDVMYMAITVSAGTHSVELRYETPYLWTGIVVTIATAVFYAAYEIIRHTRKQKGVKING